MDGLKGKGRLVRGRLGLRPQQAEAVRAVYRLTAAAGFPPSVREVGAAVGAGVAQAQKLIGALTRAGWVRRAVPPGLTKSFRTLTLAGAAWAKAGPVAVYAVDPSTAEGRRLALVLAGGN